MHQETQQASSSCTLLAERMKERMLCSAGLVPSVCAGDLDCNCTQAYARTLQLNLHVDQEDTRARGRCGEKDNKSSLDRSERSDEGILGSKFVKQCNRKLEISEVNSETRKMYTKKTDCDAKLDCRTGSEEIRKKLWTQTRNGEMRGKLLTQTDEYSRLFTKIVSRHAAECWSDLRLR